MKRTIILAGVALLFSAGLFAQTTDQTADQLRTRKRDQLQIHDQTGTGDKIQKRDQLRIHDRSQLSAQNQSGQGSMVKKMNKSQFRSATKNCASGINASRQSAMRARSGVRAGRK
ncbi:MAG TPA: hypothetical protein PLX08_04340 [Bacteroidales bacterium]|nr:hypothetical protein [Bacteroidales bacterium]